MGRIFDFDDDDARVSRTRGGPLRFRNAENANIEGGDVDWSSRPSLANVCEITSVVGLGGIDTEAEHLGVEVI